MEGLGFHVAVVNLVHADGSFEVVAVAGSDDARRELLGTSSAAGAFDAEFAVAEHWGGLRFVPHDRIPEDAVTGWIPPADAGPMVEGPDAWHPWDALFAPLTAPSGELVGMLSVDLPHDGRRPGALQRELLEMFATQAGIADRQRAAQRTAARLRSLLPAGLQRCRRRHDDDQSRPARPRPIPARERRDVRHHRLQRAELTGMTVADITHPDDLSVSLEALDAAVTGRRVVDRVEKRYVRRDGSAVWVAITSSVIRLESGENLHSITQVEDITTRKAADTELAWLVTHDPLTRLLNRAGLHENLVAALEQFQTAPPADTADGADSADATQNGALLYCDLDGFKGVNDTHGHDFGDRVLRVAANRLTEQVRDGDRVARLGGDEFVIIAEHVSVDAGVALAERIVRSLAEPLQVDGSHRADHRQHRRRRTQRRSAARAAPTWPRLLHIADTAMYQAKANGRNGHAVHRHGDT